MLQATVELQGQRLQRLEGVDGIEVEEDLKAYEVDGFGLCLPNAAVEAPSAGDISGCVQVGRGVQAR